MKAPAALAIDPIEDAILFLEYANDGKRMERWDAGEMKGLKEALRKAAPAFGPDLYRAMVAERNGWNGRAGRADINKAEQFAREYEIHLNPTI